MIADDGLFYVRLRCAKHMEDLVGFDGNPELVPTDVDGVWQIDLSNAECPVGITTDEDCVDRWTVSHEA